MRKLKATKAAEERFISAAYSAACSGIQINIMDIPRVFKIGESALAANPTITAKELGETLRTFVETIRHN